MQRPVIIGAAVLISCVASVIFFKTTAQKIAVMDRPVSLHAATTSIRWAGYSTTTYTGGVGDGRGIKSGNQICNANYPGSYWARSTDILKLGSQYPWSRTIWLSDLVADSSNDCAHWTSGSGNTGAYADAVSVYDFSQGTACSNPNYLGCVYQP